MTRCSARHNLSFWLASTTIHQHLKATLDSDRAQIAQGNYFASASLSQDSASVEEMVGSITSIRRSAETMATLVAVTRHSEGLIGANQMILTSIQKVRSGAQEILGSVAAADQSMQAIRESSRAMEELVSQTGGTIASMEQSVGRFKV